MMNMFYNFEKTKNLLRQVGAVSFHDFPSQKIVGDPERTAPSSQLNWYKAPFIIFFVVP
jgi:hypothetical protein